jgi:hypothetical protein
VYSDKRDSVARKTRGNRGFHYEFSTNMEARMNAEFYAKMQRYIVNSGIDMSVLRRRPSGTLKAVAEVLYEIDLAKFADPVWFATILDEKAKALARSCAGASWKHARKCLDIFLRKATYDYHFAGEIQARFIGACSGASIRFQRSQRDQVRRREIWFQATT